MSRKPNPNLDPYSGILPDHTCVDIHESHAKHLLQHLDPVRYGGLELRDRPDLQDLGRGIGVEVTLSISRDSLEAQSIYTKLTIMSDRGARERCIERLHQLGASIHPGFMLGPTVRNYHEIVMDSYVDKLKKLNSGGYSTLAHNELFVFAPIIMSADMQAEMIVRMRRAGECLGTAFETVWLASGKTIYKFDLENKCVVQAHVSEEQRYEIMIEARKEVVTAEKNTTLEHGRE